MDWTAVIPWTTMPHGVVAMGWSYGVVVLWLVVRVVGWSVKSTWTDSFRAAFLVLGEVGQGPPVRPGEGRLQDAA